MKIERRRVSKLGKFLIVLAAVLLVLRAALPYGVKWYVNRVLDQNPDYDGYIGDVDIHLWRGAYSIQGVKIVKTSGKDEVPFLKATKVDLSVSWDELFKGALVAKVKFIEPELNFVDAKAKEDKQTGKGQAWGDTLDKLVPFDISQLIVERGAVHFRNFQASPPVDIWIKNLAAKAYNLTNSDRFSNELFATCEAHGTALGDGEFNLSARLNPTAKKPTFTLNAKLEKLDLRALNPFFKKYAWIDFEKGRGDIVLQVAAANGRLDGYVKPILKNLQILSLKKEMERDHDNIFQIAWEAIAGAVTSLFKNHPKDQFATKIPLSGPIGSPDKDLLATIGGVLTNAFVRAFTPFYDNSASLAKARKAE